MGQKSVEWIAQIAPSSTYRNILDLGCGPGLYAERYYKKGYNITGTDFSQRTIKYARKKARERNPEINYMDINYKNKFEIVILIYCDFGVLSNI